MVIVPLCFCSARDFERWSNTFRVPTERGISYCTDCLPAYQLRMKKIGRCQHPETMFVFDEDGGVIGNHA